MARMTAEQAQQSASGGNFFKLANDKDVAIVQFPYVSREDIMYLGVHLVPVEGREWKQNVNCLRTFEDEVEACPLCMAGFEKTTKAFLQMYNHSTGKFEFWERGVNWTQQKILFLMDTYGEEDFNYRVFQIQRIGAKGDMQTKYEFALLDRVDPIDWQDVEVLTPEGNCIKDPSYEQMENYVERGVWEDAPVQAAPTPRPAANRAPVAGPRRPAAPTARTAPVRSAPAAPPAAVRRPTGANVPTGGSRTSRAQQGGGSEQF